jgi:DUF1680 family protein
MSNVADLELGEAKFSVRQETNYPWDGAVKLIIEAESQVKASFLLRIPGWLRNEVMPGDLYSYIDNASPSFSVSVNGKKIDTSIQNGYLKLSDRTWNNGDQIDLAFKMEVRKVISNEKVEVNANKMALERGPIVFCAEEIDNSAGIPDIVLNKDGSFNFQYDPELLGGLGTVTGMASSNNKNISFKAIPYYAWAHRQMGEMAVWLALE